MRRLVAYFIFLELLCSPVAHATIFGQVHGVVIELRAVHTAFTKTASSSQDSSFSIPAVPLGDDVITVSQAGFARVWQVLTLTSDTSPVLHFELQLGAVQLNVTVTTNTNTANVNTVTPTALIKES
jgi:hypothetical protein